MEHLFGLVELVLFCAPFFKVLFYFIICRVELQGRANNKYLVGLKFILQSEFFVC